MKTILSILVLLCGASSIFSQNYNDFVVLPSGVHRCKIIEGLPSKLDTINIKTNNGSLFIYPMSEVKRMVLSKRKTLSEGRNYGDIVYLKNGDIIKHSFVERYPLDTVKYRAINGKIYSCERTKFRKIKYNNSIDNQCIAVVHLKNGSIIRGTVLKNLAERTLKVKTSSGEFTYNMNEVDSIISENKVQNADTGKVEPILSKLTKYSYFQDPDENRKQITLLVGIGSSVFTNGYSSKESVELGVKWQTPFLPRISKKLFFDVSLRLYKYEAKDRKTNEQLSFTGLMVPVNVGYKYKINNYFDLLGKIGGWYQCALSAETTQPDPADCDFGSLASNVFERFTRNNYGLNVAVGAIALKHFEMTVGYELGIKDIKDSSYKNDDGYYRKIKGSVKTSNIYLTLGYKF